MKTETILDAFDLVSYWLEKSDNRNERYQRQRNAFRDRILRIDAIGKSINADLITEIEMLNAWFAEQVDVNERLRLALNDCDVEITEKDTRIAELEKELEEEKEYWRELE